MCYSCCQQPQPLSPPRAVTPASASLGVCNYHESTVYDYVDERKHDTSPPPELADTATNSPPSRVACARGSSQRSPESTSQTTGIYDKHPTTDCDNCDTIECNTTSTLCNLAVSALDTYVIDQTPPEEKLASAWPDEMPKPMTSFGDPHNEPSRFGDCSQPNADCQRSNHVTFPMKVSPIGTGSVWTADQPQVVENHVNALPEEVPRLGKKNRGRRCKPVAGAARKHPLVDNDIMRHMEKKWVSTSLTVDSPVEREQVVTSERRKCDKWPDKLTVHGKSDAADSRIRKPRKKNVNKKKPSSSSKSQKRRHQRKVKAWHQAGVQFTLEERSMNEQYFTENPAG